LADGGGIRLSVRNPILGRDKVARFFTGLARKRGFALPPRAHIGPVNGLPGYVTLETDGLPQSTALRIEAGRITGIYIVRNPHKLRDMSLSLLPRR
jgi:RNA polymerase sigma-70 factor (ECF subfamily)